MKTEKDLGVDSEGRGIIYLSESLTKIAFKKPDNIKLEVISGRESGSIGYGINFPTFINFYNNNVNIFVTQLSPGDMYRRLLMEPLIIISINFLAPLWKMVKKLTKSG